MGSADFRTHHRYLRLMHEAAGRGRFMNPTQVLTREMEEAIPDCLECHRMCLRTFSHLLTLEPDAELAEPEQLNCLLDCADMSRVCADFLLRLSEFYVRAAELCCQICRRCQQLCELPSGEDPIVLECVSTCARCANSCKRVLATSTVP